MKAPSGMLIVGMLFVLLKLTDIIDWNWFLVCLPFIVEGLAIVVGISVIKFLGPDKVQEILERNKKK